MAASRNFNRQAKREIVIQPCVLGSGRAAQAVREAIAILRVLDPELGLTDPMQLGRNDRLEPSTSAQYSLLIITNPPGLHCEKILEADRAGFNAIACEKPVCVSIEQVQQLRQVRRKVAVYHGYRQMWGPQTIKQMILAGELGDLVSIEGRYWQSSTAERALRPASKPNWKNDLALSGPSDALLDIGTHWIDLAVFLATEKGDDFRDVGGWSSYTNSEASHRDSHVWVQFRAGKARVFVSVSKIMHGATNLFEINLIGTRKSVSWSFLKPDEIFIGEGRDRRVITRQTVETGVRNPGFHGAGWLDGYVEITRQLLRDLLGLPFVKYPDLFTSAQLIEKLLGAHIIADSPRERTPHS